MRELATLQEIAEVQPIEGADAIEKVRVKEWWCVAKKGEFKTGDKCVYFEIDSLLPDSNPAFAFLDKGRKKKMELDGKVYTGFRLKTVKLRGQISQGLALPLATLFNGDFEYPTTSLTLEDWTTGTDISELLGVVKYERPLPAELTGKVKGNFPSFIPKTDEERVQNIASLIAESKGKSFYVTEKLDGTSLTVYKKDGVMGVCSRNLDLLETEGNLHWKMARKYNLEEVLPEGLAIQGEIVGSGVQADALKLGENRLYVYNVYDIVEGRYLDFEAFKAFCDRTGLTTVPILESDFFMLHTVPELLKMAEGYSTVSPDCLREGLVFRPLVEEQVTEGKYRGRLSFKAISNAYLLGETE